MAPRKCSWDCARVAAALDLGRPQVVTPGFCAWKPPASPSALGSGFQVAYSFALHACAVRLLVGRPALPSAAFCGTRFGPQTFRGSLLGLWDKELLHCESDCGILCGGVGD